MTDWLSDTVRQYASEIGRMSPHLKGTMDEIGGVPLYGNIGHAVFLRPDGSVWIHVPDWDSDPVRYEWSEVTGVARIGALVVGAKHMPEVRRLLPDRPPDAVECPKCRGLWVGQRWQFCVRCGGLGWI